jgi:hypothetical protein
MTNRKQLRLALDYYDEIGLLFSSLEVFLGAIKFMYKLNIDKTEFEKLLLLR